MAEQETVIIGLKRELKTTREKVRGLSTQAAAWRRVAHTLRSLAGLSDDRFDNLLRSESLSRD